MMVKLLSIGIIALGSGLFFYRRSLRYLRYFQQEEYDSARFRTWFTRNRAFDRKGSIVALAGGFAIMPSGPILGILLCLLGSAALVLIAYREEDPRKIGKIRLNMTERATRIHRAALLLYVGVLLAVASGIYLATDSFPASWFWLSQAIFFQTCAGWLVLGNWLLLPGEKARQGRLTEEAKATLRLVNPFVVGITGSYGKTTTKAILGEALQGLGATFWPPKSVNTPMGITREIRERLRPEHRFAIIEMGAYQRGSIRRLCNLVPPQAGIITSVGLMHLERFGSQENIYLAKSELAQAIPEDGILVCNGDNEGARRIASEYPKRVTLLYGLEPDRGRLDCWMSDVHTSGDGTLFIIHWNGKDYRGLTRLLGLPLLSNVLASFTMACALGTDPEYVLAVIRNLEPQKNRLQLIREDHTMVLNDAYNSNPIGFAAALDVLAALPGQRKILVTPGMIELGPRQEEENRAIGRKAAAVCDLVLLVGDTNREALLQGLQEGGLREDHVFVCDHRDKALSHLGGIRSEGDIVLLENDLPDLYEGDLRF